MRRTFTASNLALVTLLLVASSASGRDHSEWNGDWGLVPAKTDFQGQPVVQTGTVTIHDQKGIIVVSRSFVYTGATETFYYNDSTGSGNNSTVRPAKDVKVKTEWDKDVLKVTTTQSGATTIERYALAADGTMLVSVVRPERSPITLVFRRK
jgi:hypothetical protein